jgi:hypothetical protein
MKQNKQRMHAHNVVIEHNSVLLIYKGQLKNGRNYEALTSRGPLVLRVEGDDEPLQQ